MSIDLACFRATDDEDAARAEVRPGGPLGWPAVTSRRGLFRRTAVTEALGPAYDGFAARGYDPMVTLGTLEEALSGRPYDDITEDPRWGAEVSDAEPTGPGAVLTVTDGLQQALADADDAALRRAVEVWSRTEELTLPCWEDVTVEDHLVFARRLRDLARAARQQGGRLYCYFES